MIRYTTPMIRCAIQPSIGWIRRSFHTTSRLECGILSYFYHTPSSIDRSGDADQRALLKGLHTIKHRGPDAPPTTWQNEEKTVGLGHTRLSIIDLSDHGRQPLHSFDQHLHLSMNGELYDHDRLRAEGIKNDQYQFTSQSDSEIAMYLYRKYGLEFPKYLRGEFAITIYDAQRKMFIAVRDRFGIKPLYYTYHQNKLVFASEIKALFAFGVPAIWNEEVIYNMGQMRSLQTIYKGIQQLAPGHLLIATENGTVNISKYYDASYITRAEEQNEQRTEEEMIEGVRQRLFEAVRLRMRADVKIGVYLSGGLDSSTTLGMATTLTDQPIDTYSISFKDHALFDEQHLIDATNRHLGEHRVRPHLLTLTHDELTQGFEQCVYHYEYPLAFISAVGKYLLSKVVRENQGKVVLTGEGSDEIFSGYAPFRQDYLRHDLRNDPTISVEDREKLRQSLSTNVIGGLNVEQNDDDQLDSIRSIGYEPSQQRSPFMAWKGTFNARLKEKYKDFLVNSFYYNQSYLYDYTIKQQMLNYQISRVHSSQYILTKNLLLNTLLKAYGDRSEMAHSVEGRLPFLDHHLVDYVNHLPTRMKIKLSKGRLIEKYVLKEAARPFITNEVYTREKHPFLAPPTFLNPQSKLHQYVNETVHSQAMKDLDHLFDIEASRKKLNDLHRNRAAIEKQSAWNDLIILEGHYLLLCSFLTLKKAFNVKSD